MFIKSVSRKISLLNFSILSGKSFFLFVLWGDKRSVLILKKTVLYGVFSPLYSKQSSDLLYLNGCFFNGENFIEAMRIIFLAHIPCGYEYDATVEYRLILTSPRCFSQCTFTVYSVRWHPPVQPQDLALCLSYGQSCRQAGGLRRCTDECMGVILLLPRT